MKPKAFIMEEVWHCYSPGDKWMGLGRTLEDAYERWASRKMICSNFAGG